MTHTPVRPLPVRRSRRQDPRPLVLALADLRQLGVHGRVLTDSLLGEDDVRLQVWTDDGDLTAELLWCRPDEPAPGQLAAVRVAPGGRTVWCHPHGRCRPAGIVRFLCDLLLLDEAALTERYRLLG